MQHSKELIHSKNLSVRRRCKTNDGDDDRRNSRVGCQFRLFLEAVFSCFVAVVLYVGDRNSVLAMAFLHAEPNNTRESYLSPALRIKHHISHRSKLLQARSPRFLNLNTNPHRGKLRPEMLYTGQNDIRNPALLVFVPAISKHQTTQHQPYHP